MTTAERVKDMRVLIATPFYEGRSFLSYLQAFSTTTHALSMAGIPWMHHFTTGDAYVDRAKNSIFSYFLTTDCTDLVMIDSDLGWDQDGFMRLLLAPYDLVGGTYPMKRPDTNDQYPVAIHTDANRIALVTEEGLIPASMLPGGFLRVRKAALQEYADTLDTYKDTKASYPGKTYNFFQTLRADGDFVGEDVYFCTHWIASGRKIYLEPRVTFSHTGTHDWRGNYHEFLTAQPQPKTPDPVETTKEFRNATGYVINADLQTEIDRFCQKANFEVLV